MAKKFASEFSSNGAAATGDNLLIQKVSDSTVNYITVAHLLTDPIIAGGVTVAGAATIGLDIAKTAVTSIRVGVKHLDTAGSGVAIPSTDDWGAVRVFTDDNGANIADSVRNIQSRTLLTFAQSAGTIRGLQGQFKIVGDIGFDTGVYTPVQGYLEVAGTTHTVAAAGILTCFDASLEIGSGATVTATGYVAGYKAEVTGPGTFAGALGAAFLATNASASTAVWPHGLYIESGAAGVGITINACVTTGIDFGLTVGTTAADGNASLIRGGYAASGGHTAPNAPIAFVTANQHALQFYLTSSASKFTGLEMNVYSTCTGSGDNPLIAAEFTARSSKTTYIADMYAVYGQVQLLNTYAGPDVASGGEGAMFAGHFKTQVNTGATFNCLSACAKLDIKHQIVGTLADFTGGVGLYIRNNSSINVSNKSQAIHFSGGFESVFSFEAEQSINYGDKWIYGGEARGGIAHIRCRFWTGSAYVYKYIALVS